MPPRRVQHSEVPDEVPGGRLAGVPADTAFAGDILQGGMVVGHEGDEPRKRAGRSTTGRGGRGGGRGGRGRGKVRTATESVE